VVALRDEGGWAWIFGRFLTSTAGDYHLGGICTISGNRDNGEAGKAAYHGPLSIVLPRLMS